MRGSVQQVRDESGAPDPHVFEIGGFAPAAAPTIPETLVVEQPAPMAQHVAALPAAASSPLADKPLTTRQLLSHLRARLRVVEREIKLRHALESERDQIKRLIAAATNERNNLRAIRAAG